MATTTYPKHWINLVNEAAVITAAPSAYADGVPITCDDKPRLWFIRRRHSTTAGNDLRTFKGKIYGYCPGEINGATKALITGAEGWVDTEDEFVVSTTGDGSVGITMRGLEIFSALYFRVTDITGAGTKLSAAVTSYDIRR